MSEEMVLVEVEDADFDWMLRGEPSVRRGYSLPPGGVDDPAVLEIVRVMTRRLHAAGCRGSWMIVSGREVVGLCSYRRPPAERRVEIGYGVSESRRGYGHASRAVSAMLQRASGDGIDVIVAETSVANPASARVLQKNGFARTGTRIDAEDGEVNLWERRVR